MIFWIILFRFPFFSVFGLPVFHFYIFSVVLFILSVGFEIKYCWFSTLYLFMESYLNGIRFILFTIGFCRLIWLWGVLPET